MRDIAVVISNSNKDVDSFDIIDTVKEVGIKNVFTQWYDEDEKWTRGQLDQILRCKEDGLNILFSHLGYQNINDIWEEGKAGDDLVLRYTNDIEKLHEIGIDMVIMHTTSKTVAPMYNELGISRFKKICDFAEKLGVKVAFENTKIRGYLEYVLSNIKNSNVGICYDAGHNHAHFNDELDLSLFKNRIFAVHLHDNFGEKDEHLLPFDGTVDWDANAKKLVENGYKGPIIMEIVYRHQYSKNGQIKDFFEEVVKRGERLQEIFDKYDN